MAGLFGYMAAGAAQGIGDSIVEQGKAKRDAQLRLLEMEQRFGYERSLLEERNKFTAAENEKDRASRSDLIQGSDGAYWSRSGDKAVPVLGPDGQPLTGKPNADAPDVKEFYDEQGRPYKAQWNTTTRSWEKIGGSKAPSNGTSLTVGADGEIMFQQGGSGPMGRDGGTLGKELAKADVALIKDAREQATMADDLTSLANQLEEVSGRVGYTGPGGDLYGSVDDAIGILPGDKGARGAFRSLAMESQLAMTQKTKGAITDREMGMFREAVPNLSQTPEGNQQIVEVMRGAAERVKTRAAFYEEYVQRNGNLQNAQAAWNVYINEHPLIERTDGGFGVLPQVDFEPYLNPDIARERRQGDGKPSSSRVEAGADEQTLSGQTSSGIRWSAQ